MRASLIFVSLAFAGAIAASAHVASAQDNLRSAPTGGRTALMGGAGIALGRDGSSPFLNPATITRIADTGIAFSANFYTFTNTTFSGFHQPGPVDQAVFGPLSLPDTSLHRGRIDGLPNTLCVFVNIGKWTGESLAEQEPKHRKGRQKLAGCLSNLERNYWDATAVPFDADSAGRHVTENLSITHRWNRLWVGPTYSTYVTDRLSLGASLAGVATTFASTWNVDTLAYAADGGQAAGSGYHTSQNGYSIDAALLLGALYHVDEHQIVGVTLSLPTLHVLGHYTATEMLESLTPGASLQQSNASGGFVAPPPMRIGVGYGEERGRLSFDVDASLYIPVRAFAESNESVNQATFSGGKVTASSFDTVVAADAQAVVDVAMGAEWFLNPHFSLIGGASTDWSDVARLPQSPQPNPLAESRVNRLGASFGVGSYGPGSELLFGTELSYAWGKSVAVDPFVIPPGLELVDQHTFRVMVVVAGRTSFAALRNTFTRVLGVGP